MDKIMLTPPPADYTFGPALQTLDMLHWDFRTALYQKHADDVAQDTRALIQKTLNNMQSNLRTAIQSAPGWKRSFPRAAPPLQAPPPASRIQTGCSMYARSSSRICNAPCRRSQPWLSRPFRFLCLNPCLRLLRLKLPCRPLLPIHCRSYCSPFWQYLLP